MSKYEFPNAQKHGELREVLKDIFFVQGSVSFGGPLPVAFSRNMTVVRENGRLTLINSMRLDAAGLAKLEKLGTVENVIRLAGFHGMDDPFYKDRYQAKIWAVKGQVYAKGFDASKPDVLPYFRPDIEMDESTKLPISDARLFRFHSTNTAEGLVVMEREGGIIVAGDSLQNWHRTDEYFSLIGKIMMKLMGFIKAHNIGPGWMKLSKPDVQEIRSILNIKFEHLLPVHGTEVIGGAREAYRKVIEAL